MIIYDRMGSYMITCDHKVENMNLRIGHVYGPGEEEYKKVIPITIKKILDNKPLQLWGDGSDLRSFIFIDDVVNSIVKSLFSPINDSGINAFWQLGYNHAKTLPMNRFVGCGLTAFALTRPKDSFGCGLAWSKLNKQMSTRTSELMLQGYYQAHLFHSTYLEPVITYIPTPGASSSIPQTWVATIQVINLF